MSESQLRFLRRGIQVGEKYMPHQPVAYLGPRLDIAPHPLALAPEAGIVCRGTAVVEADSCDVQSDLSAHLPVGIKVWDGAQLEVAHSKIHDCDYGLINYARDGSVDLGPPGQSEGRNFIAPSLSQADCWRYIGGPVPDCELDASEVDMVRIYNTTPSTILAEGNSWGTCEEAGGVYDGMDCMCAEAFFLPDTTRVDYRPWLPSALTACYFHPEPPGFFLGAAEPTPEPAPEGAWPSPFNGQVHFRYRAHGQAGTLEIFDILGRKVRNLKGSLLDGGDQEFIWRGDTDQGVPVSSGVYFYRVTNATRTLKGKVVYVK